MSCTESCVARKFYSPTPIRSSAEIAAMNLRLATLHLAKLRFPPPLRKPHPLRQRLSLTMMPYVAEEVKIRHNIQNLGSQVSETQPVQTRPA